ncbi:MAG: class C beta-lactamase-related serine hydrolase [Candidatus Thorarchaeota archaeon]|nr:MAG: class C beta-lactamase-related serine hydrolase [Candidatus Thorarchaeota archaeon]
MNRVQNLVSIIGIVTILLMISVVPTQGYSGAQADVVRDYWPTDVWLNTTPEAQGLSMNQLDRIDTTIVENDIDIHSVIVVKNGYIVYEKYYGYWSQYMAHTIQSCTKSFMSALIGIAIDKGYIDNVSQPVLDFFPGYTIDNWDPRKENITLYHCLTMTTGLEFHEVDIPYEEPENDLFAMYRSNNMWQYVLDRPMEYNPGEHWSYNSGGIELLGGVIEQTTGYSVADFADEFLFEPIGIDYFQWWIVPASGQYGCGGGLNLKPRDMARFGYLYLNNGNWNGTQVVSSDWVNVSTQPRNDADGWYNYGYTWWSIHNTTFYEATGHYEQKIFILPEEDIVVVFTGDIQDEDWHPSDYFVIEYVIPAKGDPSFIDRLFIVNASILVIILAPIPFVIIRLQSVRRGIHD